MFPLTKYLNFRILLNYVVLNTLLQNALNCFIHGSVFVQFSMHSMSKHIIKESHTYC